MEVSDTQLTPSRRSAYSEDTLKWERNVLKIKVNPLSRPVGVYDSNGRFARNLGGKRRVCIVVAQSMNMAWHRRRMLIRGAVVRVKLLVCVIQLL